MEPTNLTIEILKDIRDDVRGVKDELRQTNERVGETNRRIDETNRRLVASEIRLSTELVALTGVVTELRDDLRKDRSLRSVLVDHEHRIEALEGRDR